MTIPATFEEEILNMLLPQIKSVLRQTSSPHREDLEQELKILIVNKINSGFRENPSFFELIKEDAIRNLLIHDRK